MNKERTLKERPTIFELARLAAHSAPPGTPPKDAVKRAWALWHEAQDELREHDNRVEFLRGLFATPNGKNIPIFTDTAEEWRARLQAYPGDARDVERAMWDKEFSTEEVQKQLYRDKSMPRGTRQQLFLGLARAAINYDMEGPLVSRRGRLEYLGTKNGEFIKAIDGFPIHPKNREISENYYRLTHRRGLEKLIPAKEVRFVEEVRGLLSAPKLNAFLVRWAVEVRQRQLEAARSRTIPASLATPPDDSDRDDSIQVKKVHRQ